MFTSRKLRIAPPDIAHTFGLFCDIGVPLLMDRFADYAATYDDACHEQQRRFTEIEDERYSTNHAAIGCLLARNWGLSPDVSWAILLHHDYRVLDATNDYKLLVTEEAELAGLPDDVKAAAHAAAQKDGKQGWQFSLHFPSYYPILQFADHRALRETVYRATPRPSATRCWKRS